MGLVLRGEAVATFWLCGEIDIYAAAGRSEKKESNFDFWVKLNDNPEILI